MLDLEKVRDKWFDIAAKERKQFKEIYTYIFMVSALCFVVSLMIGGIGGMFFNFYSETVQYAGKIWMWSIVACVIAYLGLLNTVTGIVLIGIPVGILYLLLFYGGDMSYRDPDCIPLPAPYVEQC